jgi:hypothetical protein
MLHKRRWYPNARVIHEIADLAKIPIDARIYKPRKDKPRKDNPRKDDLLRQNFFQSRLNRAIDEAWDLERVEKLRLFGTEDIIAGLQSVEGAAHKLEQLLASMMDTGKMPNTLAGNFLDAVLGDNAFDVRVRPYRSLGNQLAQRHSGRPPEIERHGIPGRNCCIQTYVYQLAALSKAAKAAKEEASRATRTRLDRARTGRPRGTPGRPGLDVFVHRLQHASRGCGGEQFIVYKSACVESECTGTLVQAIELLRPWLPKRILPKASGRSLERLAKDFRAATRETPK